MRLHRSYVASTLALLVGLALTGSTLAQQPALKPLEKEPEVPYVPTHERIVAEMLKVAKVGKNDVLYDLGSGDGRIPITAAKRFGTRGVGVDIDPTRVTEARENAKKAGVSDKVKFMQQDLFETDIKEATVVTLYLLPEVNMRLRPKLLADLKPSNAFGFWMVAMTDCSASICLSLSLMASRKTKPTGSFSSGSSMLAKGTGLISVPMAMPGFSTCSGSVCGTATLSARSSGNPVGMVISRRTTASA